MFFACVFLSSQELILKVKNPANIVSWIYQKGKLENSYCLYDDNYLIIASSVDYYKPIIHIYKEYSSSVVSTSFCISNKQFVALDEQNTVLEARFDDLEKPKKRKITEKLVAKSIALSPNDEIEVLGFENGFVQTHYLMKHSKKNFDIHFKAHNGLVYFVSFNSLGQYFVTSGKDEKIKIWDSKTLNLVKEFDCYSDTLCPAVFSSLDDSFAYCTSRKTLCVSNIDGSFSKEISIMDGIKSVKFTEKKDRIAVLTDNKRLEFYNVIKGEYEGAVVSLEGVCSFDVNLVTGAILVGTEEGEVYLASNKDIKITKEKQSYVKKHQVDVEITKEVKNLPFSTNILKYLALDEEDYIQGIEINRHFLPLKDECPLEDPVIFIKKTEQIKKVPTKVDSKTLNEIGLDEHEIEFQQNTSEPKTEANEGLIEKTEQETTETEESIESETETIKNDEDV